MSGLADVAGSREQPAKRVYHALPVDGQIASRSAWHAVIDDFGTGYSSLAYLKRFDIDYLKIDKSFTSHLEPESRYMALTAAIIVMAHRLGFKVVAEGVETGHQRNLLALANCDYAQGYLFSRPLPADEFEKILHAAPYIPST